MDRLSPAGGRATRPHALMPTTGSSQHPSTIRPKSMKLRMCDPRVCVCVRTTFYMTVGDFFVVSDRNTEEVIAHEDTINTANFGQQSGRVLATGGKHFVEIPASKEQE